MDIVYVEPPDEYPQKPYRNERPGHEFIIVFQDANDLWWWRTEFPTGTVRSTSRRGYDTAEGADFGSYGACMRLDRAETEQVMAHWGDRAMGVSELDRRGQ